MKEPTEIIDIHSHVFNLKYLPVAGVIVAYSKGFVPVVIAKAIENILIALSNTSKYNLSYNKGHLINSSKTFVDDLFALNEDEIIEDIAIKASYEVELLDEELLLEALNEMNFNNDKKTFSNIYYSKKTNQDEFQIFIVVKLLSLLKTALSGFYYLRWFRFMMRGEKAIFKYLKKHNKGVSNYVFHMMDTFECFEMKNREYSEPQLDVDVQIKNMVDLVNHSGNKLIGFVAFNPNRDDGLKIVKDALKLSQFIGVKFYPPLGYKPIGNQKSGVERRINKFFKWCVEKDIPVFTHCTPDGFQSKPGISGKNANPTFWKQLLDVKEFEKLRLCLGHAGGEEGWRAKFNKNDIFPDYKDEDGNIQTPYAKLVYELCITKENVYCEVGFLSHIYRKREVKNFKLRLLHLLDDKKNKSPYDFNTKVCYGSDYHILFNEGHQKSYLKKFKKIFSTTDFDNYREGFFHKNAKTFVKLP